jgi:hypothetical protein
MLWQQVWSANGKGNWKGKGKAKGERRKAKGERRKAKGERRSSCVRYEKIEWSELKLRRSNVFIEGMIVV